MPLSLDPFALPDRYRLEGGIAAGGMAAVYAAHDTLLDRPVAVKVLADHLNDDATARARFEREGRAAAGLSHHAGVVTIFDVGEFNGRAFIVMERRMGGTIADAGRVEPDKALGWLDTIAGAIDTAHDRGIVHRDIKPGNLLLDERGAIAVADFGIASLVDESTRFTQTGQVLGTAAYLSPEQATGEPATIASDRYSLAVVAYELLTGRKPFQTGSFAAQARAHIEDPPPDAPGLPRAASDVLKRGMAKRAEDRWPTCAAFVDALRAALAEDPRPKPAPPPPARAGGERRTGALLALLATALIAAAVVGLALRGGDDPNTAADASSDKPTQASAKPAQKPRTTPEAEETKAPAPVAPEPTVEPTAEATEVPVEVPPARGGSSVSLNAKGFSLFQAGDYASAIPFFEKAAAACEGSTAIDPCGYVLFNLGASLNRAGRPDEAIPVLEERLTAFGDNESGEVEAELADARQNAG